MWIPINNLKSNQKTIWFKIYSKSFDLVALLNQSELIVVPNLYKIGMKMQLIMIIILIMMMMTLMIMMMVQESVKSAWMC